MTSKHASLRSPSVYPNLFHVIIGSYVLLMLFLLSWVFPYVFFGFTLVSLLVLFFDALFVFMVFPLNGPLFYKTVLVVGGHMVGLAWGGFLSFVAANLAYYCGSGFDCLYVVVCPFLELLWVVSMWAVGLSVLASVKKRGEVS